MWQVSFYMEKDIRVRVSQGFTKVKPMQVLADIRDGLYASQIAKKHRVSKATINRKINLLIKEDLIVPQIYTSYKTYTLTDKGLRVQHSEYHDKGGSIGQKEIPNKCRLHNVAWAFNVKDNISIPYEKAVNIRGWSKYILRKTSENVTVEFWNEPKPTFHVYIHRLFGNNAFELEKKSMAMAMDVIKGIMTEFKINVDISSMRLTRKPHYAFDDRFAEEFSKHSTFSSDTAKIDRSEGNGELEFTEPSSAQKYIDMPKNVNELLMLQQNQILIMDSFTKQLAIHLEAINGLNKGVKEWNNKLGELTDIVKKFREKD